MVKCVALVFALAVTGDLRAAAAEPVKSKDEPLAVQTADDLTLRDPRRQKDLTYKVYFPEPDGRYPVILFSHGFGGNKDAFGPVGRHWASQGYVVIHPSHADGVGRGRGEPKRGDEAGPAVPPRRGGLLGALNNPQRIEDRVADLVLILDSLDALPKAVPGLAGKIDADKVGVAGHSFGAYTAMLIGGVTADLGGEKGKRFLDKRIRCILPVSGQGTGQQGLTEQSWRALDLPMMTITGTRDRGARGQGLDWKKEPYKYSPPGDKYLVVIDGANHVSFGGGLGARGGDITDAVKLCSTRFWDAYLKDSAAAKEYLRSDRLTRDTDGKCALERK